MRTQSRDGQRFRNDTRHAVPVPCTPPSGQSCHDGLGCSSFTGYTVDGRSRTAFQWGVLGLPETFFVDREGVVVGKVSGPVSYELLSQTIDQIILGRSIGDIETGEVENR